MHLGGGLPFILGSNAKGPKWPFPYPADLDSFICPDAVLFIVVFPDIVSDSFTSQVHHAPVLRPVPLHAPHRGRSDLHFLLGILGLGWRRPQSRTWAHLFTVLRASVVSPLVLPSLLASNLYVTFNSSGFFPLIYPIWIGQTMGCMVWFQ